MPDPLIGSNKMATDRILFRTSEGGNELHRFGWVGAWPPPDELTVVVEVASGDFKVIEWNVQPSDYHEWMKQAEEKGEIRVSHWILNRASQIEEPAKPSDSWFRAAEFLRKP